MGTKHVRSLIVIAAQILLALSLLEGGLRLLRPYHSGLRGLLYSPSVKSEFDEVKSLEALLEQTNLGFVPFQERRNFILNSRSFRTGEYTGEKRAKVYRIMCLGDSFTYASGHTPYSGIWHVQLEAALNGPGQQEVEVFALGIPGVGTSFELRLWELEHHLVRPDLVILAFFVGNDFTDERRNDLHPWVETEPARLSYAFRLIRNLYRLWKARSFAREHLLDASEKQVFPRGGIDLRKRRPPTKSGHPPIKVRGL